MSKNIFPGLIDQKNLNPSAFWKWVDGVQNETLENTDQVFSYLENSPRDVLMEILIQYRYFTIYYIADLALMIARLPDGAMRSFIAYILNDELGAGDPAKAHSRLYDDFLQTIGIDVAVLDAHALDQNLKILDEARRCLISPQRSAEYAVGLRGMGGECICQVYISQLHKHLVKNPFIKEMDERIDWTFWDLHVGDHDIEHHEQTREIIDREIVRKSGEGLLSLANGYADSIDQWQNFWGNIFDLKNSSHHVLRRCASSYVEMAIVNG